MIFLILFSERQQVRLDLGTLVAEVYEDLLKCELFLLKRSLETPSKVA